MSLYIGSDNWGNRILNLTKSSHNEAQHKGAPMLDAYLDTRLPYLRVTAAYGGITKKAWLYGGTSYRKFEVPWQVKDAYNKGYIVLMAAVTCSGENPAFGCRINPWYGGLVNPNTWKVPPEYNWMPWSDYQRLPAQYDTLVALKQGKYNDPNYKHAVSGHVWQVTNARIINNVLSFDSVPNGNQIQIDNKTVRVGNLDLVNYNALSLDPAKSTTNREVIVIWRHDKKTGAYQDNFHQYLGNNNVRDRLLRLFRSKDVEGIYQLIANTPWLPPIKSYDEGWQPQMGI